MTVLFMSGFCSAAALNRRTSCKPSAHVQGSLTEPGIQAGKVSKTQVPALYRNL